MYYLNKLIQNLKTGSQLPDDIKEDIEKKNVKNLKKKFPFSKVEIINFLLDLPKNPRKPLKETKEERKRRERRKRSILEELEKEQEFLKSYYEKKLVIRTKNKDDPIVTRVKYIEGIQYFMDILPEIIKVREESEKVMPDWEPIEIGTDKIPIPIESKILKIILEYYKNQYYSRIKYEELIKIKDELFKKEKKEEDIDKKIKDVHHLLLTFFLHNIKIREEPGDEFNFLTSFYSTDEKEWKRKALIKILELDKKTKKIIIEKYKKDRGPNVKLNYYNKLRNDTIRILEYNELKYLLPELKKRTDKYIIEKGLLYPFDIKRSLSIDDDEFDDNDFKKYLDTLKYVDTTIPTGKNLAEIINKIKEVFNNSKNLSFKTPLQYKYFEKKIDEFLVVHNSNELHNLSFSLKEIKIEQTKKEFSELTSEWDRDYLERHREILYDLIGNNQNIGCQYLVAEKLINLICLYIVKKLLSYFFINKNDILNEFELTDANTYSSYIPWLKQQEFKTFLKKNACRI